MLYIGLRLLGRLLVTFWRDSSLWSAFHPEARSERFLQNIDASHRRLYVVTFRR